jgi:RimJ/RimL family protein N-acetyltransferase
MNKKIVFQGKTDKGIDVLIRYPEISDAQKSVDYINALSEERTYVTYQGEQETLESEIKFLTAKLKRIEDRKSVMLVAFSGDELIGIASIDLKSKVERHIGTLGISIAKDFRGKGVGKLLLDLIEKEAVANLPDIEIIFLTAFASNEKAIKMYENAGYKVFGRMPKGVKLENGYDDHVYKYKHVK